MAFEDFIDDVLVTFIGGRSIDWKRTYEILQKVSGKIYEDFFEELEYHTSKIDPVATVYTLIVESALDELDEIIKDIIKQYCDREKMDFKKKIEEYEDAKSEISVYKDYLDTQIDGSIDLADFLEEVLREYDGELDISDTLRFFLEEISIF